jgi:peptidoglycan/xylan/chitin deacetylase (PgdA/CDA1 family)
MYFDLSSAKITKFSVFVAGLVFFLVITVHMERYVPREYSSIAEIARSFELAAKSFQYTYKFAPIKKDQILAAALAAFRNSNSEAAQEAYATTTAAGIPVFVYHGIVKNPDRFSMTADTFSDQMFALKRAGYQTVTLEDFRLYMEGFKTLPAKSFLLTFDDGRRDSFEGADPILKAAGFNAVMFVPSVQTEQRDNGWKSYYLDYDGIVRMLNTKRWEIGSHAIQKGTLEGQIYITKEGKLGNFLSNRMWLWTENRIETEAEYNARVLRELRESKIELEETFGVPIYAFAYPFSDSGNQSVNYPQATTTIGKIISDTYSIAFEQVSLENNNPTKFIGNTPDVNHAHIRRIEVGSFWTGKYLVEVLDGGLEKSLPYTDIFQKNNGWRGTWGIPKVEMNVLHVAASTTTAGAFTFLDGAREWKDYIYSINAEWEKGTHVTLAARFTDTQNFASCVFSMDRVKIEEKVGGTTRILTQVKNPVILPVPNVSLGISVQGSMIKCLEGSRVVAVAYDLSPKLYRGTIALQAWDQFIGNASLRVRTLNAIPIESSAEFLTTLPSYDLQ